MSSAPTGILLHFRVRYHTVFGQNLFIVGSQEELGNWENPIPMHFEGVDDYWVCDIELPIRDRRRRIQYKYILFSKGSMIYEPESNHSLWLGTIHEPAEIEVCDSFKWSDPAQDAFTRSAFVDVVMRRQKPTAHLPEPVNVSKYNGVAVYFSVCCPHVRSNQTLKVVGSVPELGNWDPGMALELNDHEFPMWSGTRTFSEDSLKFEYKFIIVGEDGSVIWESCGNRTCAGLTVQRLAPAVLVLSEWYVCPMKELFKGMGIYCPLFSLRTDESCGIGQYTDVKKVVDLCTKIGASLIQLLPINDTCTSGGWDDSYPYGQVSCFALHPMYVNLSEAAEDLPQEIQLEIVNFRSQHDMEKNLNVPVVYQFKQKMLETIYQLVKPKLNGNRDFQQFVKDNGDWLNPYALFCYFRKLYKEADFHKWPEHKTISEDEVGPLVREHVEDLEFTYWVQFVCNQQWQKVKKYAEQKGVVLKGDLPIGVILNSCECWASPKNFKVDMCAGAPPDQFSSDGQNWLFPTYDWDYMEKDNYRWWRQRLARMATLYHALRIDHILGFFRIWEIPRATCVRGMLGHFYPAIPLTRSELEGRGLWDIDRYVKPYVRWHLLAEKFGNDAMYVARRFFDCRNMDPFDDWFDFKMECDSEVQIKAIVKKEITDRSRRKHYRICLYQLLADVLLVRDPVIPDAYHVRTICTVEHTEKTPKGVMTFESPSWRELPEPQKTAFQELHDEFMYRRQSDFWLSKANDKLDMLKNTTKMLICAEDLGQLTDGIVQEIRRKAFLSLRVQRMSKDSTKEFDEIDSFDYLSVCCPGTHDSPSLRGWWEEDSSVIKSFWHTQLNREDTPWGTCAPWISQTIIEQHLWSNSMWAIFLLQDLTGIMEHLRRQTPDEERINDPSNSKWHWCYRYPYTVEELTDDQGFTSLVKGLVESSHRL